MQAAWAQVGEIDKANRGARAGGARKESRDHAAHASRGRPGPAPAARPSAGPAYQARRHEPHHRRTGRPQLGALDRARAGSMRRAMRPTGPIALASRRAAPPRSSAWSSVDGVKPRLPPRSATTDGVGGLSVAALESLDPVAVAQALGQPPDVALADSKNNNDIALGAQTLATTTTTPNAWKRPDVAFQPGKDLADRIGSRLVERLPDDAADGIVLAVSAGGLLAGLAVAEVEDRGRRASGSARARGIGEQLPGGYAR